MLKVMFWSVPEVLFYHYWPTLWAILQSSCLTFLTNQLPLSKAEICSGRLVSTYLGIRVPPKKKITYTIRYMYFYLYRTGTHPLIYIQLFTPHFLYLFFFLFKPEMPLLPI